MNLTFTSYEIRSDHINLLLTVVDPPAGQPATYRVRVTDAELTAATTNALLRALVLEKLNRQVYATSIAARLDPLLGALLTI